MSSLVNFSAGEKAMTSLQIAELVQTRHDVVKKSIDRLVSSGVIIQPPLVDEQSQDAMGRNRTTQAYVFSGEQGKLNSITVVAQLCPQFTSALVKRWYELEAQVKQVDPMQALSDPIALRSLLLGYTEKVIQLEQKVSALEPKAKGLDRIADSNSTLGIREAAKVLKIKQNQLTQYLMDKKVVYRDLHGKIQAYQKSIDQKLVRVTTSSPRLFETGEKVFTQVKLTQKLITRIASWLEREEEGCAA